MSTTLDPTESLLDDTERLNSTTGCEPKAGASRRAGANVQTCPQCNTTAAWGATSWCPECGFYPRLGTSVEIDRPISAAQAAPDESAWDLFPSWARVVAVLCGVSLAEVAIVAVMSWSSQYRAAIGAAHVAIGLLAVLSAHVRAYFFAITDTDKYSPVDMAVNPLSIWRPAVQALPRTQRMLSVACCGLILSLGGMAMIGRDFNRIFEVSPLRKKKIVMQNPGATIAKSARSSDLDMEEAMTEFAGEGSAAAMAEESTPAIADSGETNAPPKEQPAANTPPSKLQAECVIIGFQTDDAGGLSALLLAGRQGDEPLRFVSRLAATSIPAGERANLSALLRSRLSASSSVACSLEGIWVKPTLHCLIGVDRWNDDGTLEQPVWRELRPVTAAATSRRERGSRN